MGSDFAPPTYESPQSEPHQYAPTRLQPMTPSDYDDTDNLFIAMAGLPPNSDGAPAELVPILQIKPNMPARTDVQIARVGPPIR